MAWFTNITITEELRPAISVSGKKLLVHVTRQSHHGLFVCEMEDGSMGEFDERGFQFLDSDKKFDEWEWGEQV